MQEMAQQVGLLWQEFMDLFSGILFQCPSDSFPIEILNPNERGRCVHFGMGAYPVSATYDPGNTVISHSCDHRGLTPVYQSVFPEREN